MLRNINEKNLTLNLKLLINAALDEDIGSGDITSELLIPEDLNIKIAIVAREKMVICGTQVTELVYAEIEKNIQNKNIKIRKIVEEGDEISAKTVIAEINGAARAILAGERTVLNIMQRMTSVATLTRKYVEAVKGTKAKILDTRKTMPAMRFIDKYAVRVGGGENHRLGLYDAILVKDNHLAGIVSKYSSLKEMVEDLKSKRSLILSQSASNITNLPIYVECDDLSQFTEVIAAAPDRVMLDNMSIEMLREAVKISAGKIPLEASGGVNLGNVREIAETGVDYISVGAITHSAIAVDIGFDHIKPPHKL